MRIFILICLLPFLTVVAQYTGNDYELVKTTFSREFDKDIISSYLNSGDKQKTRAALLSIANSDDTSRVSDLINLEFDTYGKSITFTLGKLGASKISSAYLLEKLESNLNNKLAVDIISNIGRTGSDSDLALLDSVYNRRTGYPTAVFNFGSRNINSDQSIINLIDLLDTAQINSDSQFETLFSIYRIGPDKSGLMKFVKFIECENKNNKLYALGCLRKLSAFPDDFNLMKSILKDDDWRVRVEGLKVICFKGFNSIDEISFFTSLLYDINPNVSRTAAASLKNIRITAILKTGIHDLIIKLLTSHGFNENTIGELFISYCSLFPENIYEKIEEYEDRIKPEFIHTVLTDNTDDPDWNFEYLLDQFKDVDEKQLISLVPPLLSLQTKLMYDEDFTDLVLSLYSGGYAAPLALLSFGLDTVFVQKNQQMFQQLIIDQTFKFLNNPHYAESLISFPVLAGKVSDPFKQTVLTTLASSTITSVANYAGNILSEDYRPVKKDLTIFEKIWKNSFKYSEAIVTTGKGNFTIQFKPEFAPVSVGNFCFLAEQNFFDNIIYHRVVPNFVIQTGDPTSTGWGGPGYEIVSELSYLPYDEAAVGMASAGKDTEGSQWFVMHSYHPHLNGNYSLFGEVTEGMSIIFRIDQGEIILNVTLIK